MSRPQDEAMKTIIGLRDERDELRDEIERLRAQLAVAGELRPAVDAMLKAEAEVEELRAEVERLRELKTPASRQLLDTTKVCLDSAEAEIERLRAALTELVEHEEPGALFSERIQRARRALGEKP
jgi:DnaJ-domain-containing protein 1